MATRIKQAAQTYASQSRDDVQSDIRAIGDLLREHTRQSANMNDEIAAITSKYKDRLDSLSDSVTRIQGGVQTWCEAHREEICGKGKSANLITGEVSWRQRPPSISIRGADDVVSTLLRNGLERFVRTEQNPNKQAMLNDPEAVRGVKGISIVTGVEDFVITPFELNTEAA